MVRNAPGSAKIDPLPREERWAFLLQDVGQIAEKIDSLRLLKNAQMQGARNSEE